MGCCKRSAYSVDLEELFRFVRFPALELFLALALELSVGIHERCKLAHLRFFLTEETGLSITGEVEDLSALGDPGSSVITAASLQLAAMDDERELLRM